MDKKIMLSDSCVLWRITDPLKFAQTLNSSVVNAEGRIDTVVYNSVKNVISSMSQNEVISGPGITEGRQQYADSARRFADCPDFYGTVKADITKDRRIMT